MNMNYFVNEYISWEYVGDQENDDVIIFNEKNETVFIINHSAMLVLEALNKGLSVEEIIEEVAQKYIVPATEIRDDILQIIGSFLERNIIYEAKVR